MREQRNPFRLRSSEQIVSDTAFIRFFEPGILDLLPTNELWTNVHIIRSAPGGGKTSLMRLFTPSSLLTLHAYRTTDECKDLYQRMCNLGTISDVGPNALGVIISCRRNYSALDDIDLEPFRKERLFFSLLNARVVLATLRSALDLKKLSYPADLDRIDVTGHATSEPLSGIKLPCNGKQLYDWAENLEAKVCDAIDSFGPIQEMSLPGHNSLSSLSLLIPGCISIDGIPVADRTILMLDDVHALTRQQRERLVQTIVDARSPVSVWLAERFEALSTSELLSSGAIEGRDYGSVISLENLWYKRRRRFETVVLNIADRRARSASNVEIGSFSSQLETSLDWTEWQQPINNAVAIVSDRVKALARHEPLFQEWIAARDSFSGTPRERLIAWRALEILIERENRKSQRMFEFDWALSTEDLENKDDAAVKAAAELFLANEFRLPYYFGSSKLANIASLNIEQFLELAGDEFEEIVSAALIKKSTILTPHRQEAILKKAVQNRWNTISQRVQNGSEVKNFLNAVGQFSRWSTYRPNAPYAPGVTGIAISMADRDKLQNIKNRKSSPLSAKLAEILASSLAHHLLEPILDYQCKGERWMVLYLNRFLCVQFQLPLQYGGWKEKSLQELCQWLEQGFKDPKEEHLL